MKIAVHYKLTGLVQGVGFRFHSASLAHRFGLVGWTRNTDQGAVETLVQGEESSIKDFETLLVQGPRGSRVEDWEKRSVPLMTELSEFSILGP